MADAKRSRRSQDHPAGMALRVVLAGMLLLAGSATAAPAPLSEKEDLGMLGIPPEELDPVTVPRTLAMVQEPACHAMRDAEDQLGHAGEPAQDLTQRVCTPLLSQPGVTRPPIDPEDPEATLWWVHDATEAAQAEAEDAVAAGQEQAGSFAQQAQRLPDELQKQAERLPEDVKARAGELQQGANATAGEAQAQAGAAQEEAERTAEDPLGGVARAVGTAKGLARDAVGLVKDLWPF